MENKNIEILKKKLSKKFFLEKMEVVINDFTRKRKLTTDFEKIKTNLEIFLNTKKSIGRNFWGYGIHRIDNGLKPLHSNNLNGKGIYLTLFQERKGKLRFIYLKITFDTHEVYEEIENKSVDFSSISKISTATTPGNIHYLTIHSKMLGSKCLLQIDEKDHLDYFETMLNQKSESSKEENKIHVKEIIQKREDLRSLLLDIKDKNQNDFLEEAIKCLEINAYRAAIIMVWNLTLDHLFSYILTSKLIEFNSAIGRRSGKESKITVTIKDDFSLIKENIFIEVCKSANIISNDVRKILDANLGVRNSCAHPSNIKIKRTKAVSVVDELIENVLKKY